MAFIETYQPTDYYTAHGWLYTIQSWFTTDVDYITLPKWMKCVELAKSPELYQKIVTTMFDDGIVNQGRLRVLEEYTMDVCERYPRIAPHIWECNYKEWVVIK